MTHPYLAQSKETCLLPSRPGGKRLTGAPLDRLLVRGTNWVGDAVMTLPALSALRHTFPNARITVLAKPWVADIYRWSRNVDCIFPYLSPGPYEGPRGVMKLARELRQYHFDASILFQNAIEAAIIAFFAHIPIRAGYDTDGRGFLLTHAVRRQRVVKKLHQTHYYLEMVRALGCSPGRREPKLTVPPEVSRSLSLPKGDMIGLAPGAQYGPAKQWFPERFAAVADRLIEAFGLKVILFGAASDRETTSQVSSHARHPLIDLAGKTSLAQAMAVIAQCRLFITNDSGLMHVAAALGVPVVAIFGSTDPVATGPVGSPARIVRHPLPCSPCFKTHCPTDFRCMTLVEVEEVLAAARELWEQCYA